MDKKTKVNVRIFGSDYVLVGSESEEYLNKVAFNVDKKMRELSSNPTLKPMKVSVLTALNICDDYFKLKSLYEQSDSELKKYKDEIASLKLEKSALEEEKRFLKGEIQEYRRKLSNDK